VKALVHHNTDETVAIRSKYRFMFLQHRAEKYHASVNNIFSASENISILYRACAVESGDFDSEPAMGTLDNCGFVNTIRFNDRDMRGCIVSCRRDGCNIAATYYVPPFWLVSVVSLVLARVAFVL